MTAWAVAGGAPVTLSARLMQPSGQVQTTVLEGRIESGVSGQLVTVLAKVCPRTFETSVAGGSTFPGGVFQITAFTPRTAVTYRARWEDHFSEPVRVWPALPVESERAGRSITVRLDTSQALQSLSGKRIELQRRDPNTFGWQAYRAARLKRDVKVGLPFVFTTTFTGVPPGLTVRLRIPAKTAAPCFQAQTTQPIRRSRG